MAATVTSCGIYVRISRDDKDTKLGVTRQKDDCLAEAARRGWPVGRVFDENNTSATNGKLRDEYTLMLKAIEGGAIDAVIVWDVDRLTRTPSELEHFIDLADRHRLALASVGGEIDLATPQGRLTARLKGSVARHEVDQMSRRLKRKFQENMKDGKPHGQAPFGYRRERAVDDRGRDLGPRDVIDDREADAIRELYRMTTAGESLRTLAKYLNCNGFRSRRGLEFSGTAVGNMLRRPRYAGHRTHQGQIIGKGDWEPIVSQGTWDRAYAVLTTPGRRHARGTEPKYLGSGLYLCGREGCGSVMRPNVHKAKPGGRTRQPAYVCPKCMKLTRKMEPVDEVVEALIVGRLSMPDAATLTATKPDALKAALDARDAVLARMDTAADQFAEGTITARQLTRINEQLKAQLAVTESDVARNQSSAVLEGMTGRDAAAAWAEASLERRREIIRTLATVMILPSGPGIRFAPEHVKIDWKGASDDS